MTNFHTKIEGDDLILSAVDGQGLSFTRKNHQSNEYIINVRLAIRGGVQASNELAFDARVIKHSISHGPTGTPDLPCVYGEGFTVIFEHWNDYTKFCKFCNIPPQIFNEQTRPLNPQGIKCDSTFTD